MNITQRASFLACARPTRTLAVASPGSRAPEPNWRIAGTANRALFLWGSGRASCQCVDDPQQPLSAGVLQACASVPEASSEKFFVAFPC